MPAGDKDRVSHDPDYIHLRRFGNSLRRAARESPNGLPDLTVQQALHITSEQMQEMDRGVVAFLTGDKPECYWCGVDLDVPGFCSQTCADEAHIHDVQL